MRHMWTPPPLDAGVPGGYGMQLLEALLALVAVCLLAWVALRLTSRFGLGRAAAGGAMRVRGRLPLDARRSVCLIEVGSRVFLVGLGEGAAPRLLAELDPETLPHEPTAGSRRFPWQKRPPDVGGRDASSSG